MKTLFITWDVGESVDVEELQDALNAVFDGKNCPHVAEVETPGDYYALAVSSQEPEDVQKAFDDYLEDLDKELNEE
jgi:hypothetical protein